MTKWHKCELNGWKVLNDAALNEILCLKVHIRKGCLSDISPSAGTNRNEALQRHLNPHFANRSRIGFPLALALIAILLFQHNCRIETNSLVNSLRRFNYGDANIASQTLTNFWHTEKGYECSCNFMDCHTLIHISSFNPNVLSKHA